MGIAKAISVQAITSPRFGSSWEFLSENDLIDFHASVVSKLQHIPHGPADALREVFLHHTAIQKLSKSGVEFFDPYYSPTKRRRIDDEKTMEDDSLWG
jgi:hypothetical protein